MEFLEDDQFWGRAKKLPLDPDNGPDRISREFLKEREMLDKVRSAEEFLKVKEVQVKAIEEAIKEAQSRKLIRKEELLERIREYENRRP